MFKHQCIICGTPATYKLKHKNGETGTYYTCTEHMKNNLYAFNATKLVNPKLSPTEEIVRELRTW